jgi:Protein of unknown function (DUF3592)
MWFFRLWSLLCLSVGVLLVGVAIRNQWKGLASRRWRQAEGRILRAMVLVQTESDRGKSYTPQVEYEYTVDGVEHRGNRLRYGQTGSWGVKQAKRTVGRFIVGEAVPVWFNPQNHADSVLLRGTSWGNLAILCGGLVFLGAAYALWAHVR